MKCEHARRLIATDEGVFVAAREARALDRHLAGCPECRAYRARYAGLLSSLDDDAQSFSPDVRPTPAFAGRLHSALLEEAASASRRRTAAIERLLDRALQTTSAWPVRAARAVAAAAVFAALVALMSAAIQAPVRQPSECKFGHLASFSVQGAHDGRVYAALTERESIGRCNLKEAYLR